MPENDSHGELLFAIAEVYRYRRDPQLLKDMWPHVVGAVHYMDELRLVDGLRTPYGELGYTMQRDGQQVTLRLSPGLRVPSGGVVLQLPAALTGGIATIDGVPAQWGEAGELRIDRVPAEVVIARR